MGAGLHAQEVHLLFNGSEAQMRVPLEASVVKGAPYSADTVVESTQSLADGNRIARRSTGRVYRDSAGRTRREEDSSKGKTFVSIVDPVAGVSYTLDPDSRTAWKSPARMSEGVMRKIAAKEALIETQGARAREGGAGAASTKEREKRRAAELKASLAGVPFELSNVEEQHADEQLPPKAIEGVRATGHRTTTTIPAGAIGNDLPIVIVSEEWRSADLGVLVMTRHSDPRTGESSYKLQNIVRAEPDPSLFQVPPDYTVRETPIERVELKRH